jgi:hypothetical protein
LPWKTTDVDDHIKNLSDKQKNVWVRVANSALSSCEEAGKSGCEASAIKQANTVAKGMQEGGYVLFEAEMSDNDVRNALEQAIRAALPKGEHDDGYVWVADVCDGHFVYEDNRTDTPGMYRRSYTLDTDGSVLLGEPTKVTRQTVYVPVEESARPGLMQRALDMLTGALRREVPKPSELHSDLIPLIEKSVREDGTVPIKIIAPGQGGTAYYPAEILERDGPKVFTKGTHMYLDHPTMTEENERPERSVRDLVGALATDARYMAEGPDGPGLYGDAAVIAPFRDALDELAPHIGVSIRALGSAPEGQVEGHTGPVLERFDSAISVDFVTAAGAGGKVLELMESVRGRILNPPKEDPKMANEQELKEAQGRAEVAEKERDELKEAKAKQDTELARLQEANVGREAREAATEVLGKVEHLPELTRDRLVESLSKSPPTKDGGLDRDAYGKAIEEAAKAEIEYLANLTKSGSITGMGGTDGGEDAEKIDGELGEQFQRLGLSESGAKIAVAGRR